MPIVNFRLTDAQFHAFHRMARERRTGTSALARKIASDWIEQASGGLVPPEHPMTYRDVDATPAPLTPDPQPSVKVPALMPYRGQLPTPLPNYRVPVEKQTLLQDEPPQPPGMLIE